MGEENQWVLTLRLDFHKRERFFFLTADEAGLCLIMRSFLCLSRSVQVNLMRHGREKRINSELWWLLLELLPLLFDAFGGGSDGSYLTEVAVYLYRSNEKRKFPSILSIILRLTRARTVLIPFFFDFHKLPPHTWRMWHCGLSLIHFRYTATCFFFAFSSTIGPF